MFANPTAETLALAKTALANKSDPLSKGVTTSSGLAYYDLQAPAKNLYPTITPLRNSIPRVSRAHSGTATNWKVVSNITGSGFNAMGWVPEGQRSGTMAYTTASKAASYVTLGEEDYLTFEAEAAGEGFEDLNATVTMRLLQKMMMKEEFALLGGNASMALGTPSTPSLSAAGSGATLPAATYSVIVVALTLEGLNNSTLAGGVATTKSITGADGKTFTLNGGSSNKSSNATQAVTLGQTLSASVAITQGAIAYAWFVGTVGNETLQAITTINSATFAAALTAGRQTATAITQDCSTNANYAFDGIMTQALNPATPSYFNALATGTAGTGTTLTASGSGTINEIDTMLQSMWDNYRLGPTVLYVNSQELKNISKKILTSASAPLLRYDTPASGSDGYKLVAGGQIEMYFNPFTATGGSKIPIKIHPNVPAGTIVGYAEELPTWYQSNEVPNVAEVITRRDYYRMDWPLRTRQREYGVYAEEVLAVYAPFSMGCITNIANG